MVAICRSLNNADGVDDADSTRVRASITLLADYSIIDREMRSIFKANGVFQLLLTYTSQLGKLQHALAIVVWTDFCCQQHKLTAALAKFSTRFVA
jgi:hypothetical protein